jgi:hypothetical protein
MVISLIFFGAAKSVTVAPAVTLLVTLQQVFKPSFACEISLDLSFSRK